MQKKITSVFITTLFLSGTAMANISLDTPEDYTGEAFFSPPSIEQRKNVSDSNKTDSHTVPPLKQLRLKLQNNARIKEQKLMEAAPTGANDIYSGEVETSEFASKEIKDDFEDMSPDEFDADEISEENSEKNKKHFFRRKKQNIETENTENIILDCEKVDYDTNNYLIYATGNANVEFVKQKTVVKADTITFDRLNNTIKAEGNVRIVKNGRIITGDYIFVDMNEENALIENPITQSANIEMKSRKGYVYGDKIVQENGNMEINDSFPIDFHTATAGPQMRTMLVPKGDSLTEDMSKGIVTFQAKDIKITQKGDLEIIALKKPRLFKGDKLVFKTPSVKIYSNKNHDYAETDHWEIGSIRGLGLYVGPGFVAELPKGSVLKAIPMLNYKSGFGIGGVGRFQSGTNHTTVAYGTAVSKFLVYGKQNLDDHLYLHYAMNNYMPEWFLGRRRPKYGVSLVYDKNYSSRDFLIKNHLSSFRHRIEGGYFANLDFDGNFEKIRGVSDLGTTRFRYMAEARQNLYEYKNEETLKAFRFDVVSQLSAGLYGTGDTQVIGRLGPSIHTQYKRWMQDIRYYFSVYDDNTPMPLFDAYRYGQQSLYLREYFRICRWLTVSWFGMMNLTNDAPNGKTFQENGFYFSFGPDDLKFNLGYDFVRETLRCTVEVMMDAKGTKVEYDRFEIKQDEKNKKTAKKEEPAKESPNKAPVQPKVLNKAIVENVKVHEDVL